MSTNAFGNCLLSSKFLPCANFVTYRCAVRFTKYFNYYLCYVQFSTGSCSTLLGTINVIVIERIRALELVE